MEDPSSKINKETSRSITISNFIRNPLDKTINPRHIISFTLDKKRAKSLLRKIDRTYQTEKDNKISKPVQETLITIEQVLNEMERMEYMPKKLKKILQIDAYSNVLPTRHRKDLWFLASGAKLKQSMEPDYYKSLLKAMSNYPTYFQPMIEKDLKRTFPEKPQEETIEMLKKMRRNPIVGYCQGLNFIVARIIEVVDDEEESFWILTALVEDILPIDYFSSMVGVLVDQKIFSEMVYVYDRDLARKFVELEVDPSLFSLQWFVCCYVSTFSIKLCNIVWDLLFIEGAGVLYKAGLVFLHSLKQKILEVKEFNEIFSIIEEYEDFMDEKDFLKKLSNVYISKKLVRLMKKQYQWIIEEELQVIENKKKLKSSLLNQRELLACKPDWPVCLDVLEKSKQRKRYSSTFTYRVSQVKGSKLNYFSSEFKHTHYHKYMFLKKKVKGKERAMSKSMKKGDLPLEPGRPSIRGSELEISPPKESEKDKSVQYDSPNKIKDKYSEPGNEFVIKFSETPLILQNHLVIGRHDHTCKESLMLKKQTKKQISPNNPREKKVRMEEYIKDSIGDLAEHKASPRKHGVISRPALKQSKFSPPVVSKSFAPTDSPDLKEENQRTVGSFLRGLFGSNFFKKQPTKNNNNPEDLVPSFNDRIENEKQKSASKKAKSKLDLSSDEDEMKEANRSMFADLDEDEFRIQPRKTIYNYLMDPDLEEGAGGHSADSAQKSIMFMKEFFKD